MLLTRASTTRASSIAIPAHVLFAGLLGVVWVAQDPQRTDVGALQALRHLWPIQDTGLILVALACFEGVAIMLGQRQVRGMRNLAGIALCTGALVWLIFAGLAVASLHLHWTAGGLVPGSPTASISAPLWPLYVAVCHVASAVSLAFYDQRQGAA